VKPKMNVNVNIDKKDLPKYIRDKTGREYKLCLIVDTATGKPSYRYIPVRQDNCSIQ